MKTLLSHLNDDVCVCRCCRASLSMKYPGGDRRHACFPSVDHMHDDEAEPLRPTDLNNDEYGFDVEVVEALAEKGLIPSACSIYLRTHRRVMAVDPDNLF